jgi:hypothetical protein
MWQSRIAPIAVMIPWPLISISTKLKFGEKRTAENFGYVQRGGLLRGILRFLRLFSVCQKPVNFDLGQVLKSLYGVFVILGTQHLVFLLSAVFNPWISLVFAMRGAQWGEVWVF